LDAELAVPRFVANDFTQRLLGSGDPVLTATARRYPRLVRGKALATAPLHACPAGGNMLLNLLYGEPPIMWSEWLDLSEALSRWSVG
jgi:hypothetical protein